jgi:hypothetical protein
MMPFSTTPMGAKGVLTFLEDPHLRLLFFGGKGGVGKATGAMAAALRDTRRSPQGSFLLFSTDPAHSLTDSLGDFQAPPNLKVLKFNLQESLETFKARHHGKFAEIAARGTFLDEEGIRRILDLSLPGMDELMALLSIAGWAERRAYDLIVVDTAPPGAHVAAADYAGIDPQLAVVSQPGHSRLGLSLVRRPEPPGAHQGQVPANLCRAGAFRYLSPEGTPRLEAPG